MPWMTSLKSICEARALVRSALINWVVVILLAAIAGTTLAQAQVRELDGGRYQHLRNTDISGNDYASGFERRDLRGIGVRQCARRCLADSQCAAFTHNGNKRICFLKTAAGKKKRFRRATSGIVTSRSSQPVTAARSALARSVGGSTSLGQNSATSGFQVEILFNTDLPGNDYANGLRVPELAGISRNQCLEICKSDDRCRAYTHNGNNNVCILKNGLGGSKPFRGATSGIVSNRPKSTRVTDSSDVALPSSEVASSADIAWLDGDTEATYIRRIRQAARPMGEACKAELPKITSLQEAISTTFENTTVNIGKTIDVSWSGGNRNNRLPLYLVVSTDAAVRFQGTGHYSLMPNAVGPFGIEVSKSETRAIVPLFGFGAKRSGTIRIEPLIAGNLKIDSYVVGYQRSCANVLTKSLDTVFAKAVPSSLPKIDLDSRLVESRPDSYIISPDKIRLIETRADGTWRLLDAADLRVIADLPGENPLFSGTGRFVSVGGYDEKQVFDAVDGKLVMSADNDLSWANHDSFMVSSSNRHGRLAATNSLSPDVSFTGGGYLQPRSSGFENGVRFDQENGFFIDNAWSFINISRLHEPGQIKRTPGKMGLQKQLARRHLGKYFIASPISTPENWVLVGGLKSPMRAKYPHETDADYKNNIKTPFQGGITLSVDRIQSTALAQNSANQTNAQPVAFRSIIANEAPRVRATDVFVRRLSEFGIETLSADAIEYEGFAASDLYLTHRVASEPQRKFGNAAFEKIISEVPAIAQAIPSSADYWACSGRALDYARKHLIGGKPLWIAHLVCKDGALDFYQETFNLIYEGGKQGRIELDLRNPDSSSGVECFGSLTYCATKSAVYDGRYLYIWSREAKAFALIDGKTMQVLHKQFDLPRGAVLENMIMLPNRDQVLQLNSDGSFFIHRLSTRTVILSGRVIDDEVIVWTQGLNFDATPEGAHLVNLTFDGVPGKYSFQQFDARLKVPGLVQRVLANEVIGGSPEVPVPPKLEGSFGVQGAKIIGRLVPNSFGDLRSVRVYQEGNLTDEITIRDNGSEVQISVQRQPGARWISMVAVDKSGLVSLPIGRDIGEDQSARSKVRLLAVGIDDYNDENVQDLNFAAGDATTLANSLEMVSGTSFDLEALPTLLNRNATPENILTAAEKLVADTQPGEQAVFFFAGHGVKGEDGRYYMATSNVDITNISGTALSWDKLAAILARSRGRMTVFIDACHSGAAGTDFFATNDEAAAGILKNIPSGLTVMSASKGRELSEESPDIGGGYFTKAVAEVISGSRSEYDTNRNGAIEVSELYRGVKRQVTTNTNGRQTPWLARNQMIGDFAVF